MSKYVPYHITTEAGKALFTQMNHSHGSSVWGPVGEGIAAVEAEITERIIKLLLNERWDAPEIATPYVRHAIALIEGENNV